LQYLVELQFSIYHKLQSLCYNPPVKISEIGEFGLIRELNEIIEQTKNPEYPSWKKLLIGIGDDTAVWENVAPVQLATTDCIIQDVHFDLNISTWKELGWKAIAVNLSDIASMGGIPSYALISLALPDEIEVDLVKDLYRGMMEVSNQFEVAIVGGNVSSASAVSINVTLMGSLKSKNALTRSAARIGDKVAITGYTGLSAAGLYMLKRKLAFDAETGDVFRKAHLKPVPRVKEGQALLKGAVKAAIDISDGLIADLSRMCESSEVGAKILVDSVPIHPLLQTAFPDDSLQMALTGGEDYELLFSAPVHVIEKVQKTLNCSVTIIGEIVDNPLHKVDLINKEGNLVPLQNRGWEHFKSTI
jgi:thiamine-monophosphate kinase